VPEPLKIDGETIRSTASSLLSASGLVPTMTPLDLTGCGSAAVTAAAANFNDRSKKFVALTVLQLADIGNDAQGAADAWDAQEAALATNAGAMP